MSREVPSSRILWLAAGFGVWASAFAALYGLQGLGCGLGWAAAATRTVLLAALALHLAALVGLALGFRRAEARRPEGAFILEVAVWTTYAAVVATLLSLAPPLFLTVCQP